MTELSSLPQALRAARRTRHQITQREAAQFFGVSQPSYNRWENGSDEPAQERRGLVAEFLGVSAFEVEVMLGGHSELMARLATLEDAYRDLMVQVETLTAALKADNQVVTQVVSAT